MFPILWTETNAAIHDDEWLPPEYLQEVHPRLEVRLDKLHTDVSKYWDIASSSSSLVRW